MNVPSALKAVTPAQAKALAAAPFRPAAALRAC
jgi:hypothetical protein